MSKKVYVSITGIDNCDGCDRIVEHMKIVEKLPGMGDILEEWSYFKWIGPTDDHGFPMITISDIHQDHLLTFEGCYSVVSMMWKIRKMYELINRPLSPEVEACLDSVPG